MFFSSRERGDFRRSEKAISKPDDPARPGFLRPKSCGGALSRAEMQIRRLPKSARRRCDVSTSNVARCADLSGTPGVRAGQPDCAPSFASSPNSAAAGGIEMGDHSSSSRTGDPGVSATRRMGEHSRS